jgi:hypothetical protein
METNYVSFRFEGLLVQLLLNEDQILTFRTMNAIVFFASVLLICSGSIYGTYLLIGASQTTIALFNSSIGFRLVTIVFALVVPCIAIWLIIRFARRTIANMRSTEELENFLANRRGNITIDWDDVDTGMLEGSKVVLNLKKGGFRSGQLKQVYYPQQFTSPLSQVSLTEVSFPSNSSPPSSLQLLEQLLSRKLGPRLEIRK